MARYTCCFVVSVSVKDMQALLVELLQNCNLIVQYYTWDYILASEIPGTVPFSKMVKVEVFIEISTATDAETRMSIVVKNEELPLQLNNHCRQVFETVKQAIENCRYWHLIESLADSYERL